MAASSAKRFARESLKQRYEEGEVGSGEEEEENNNEWEATVVNTPGIGLLLCASDDRHY